MEVERLDDVMRYYYFIRIMLYCLTGISGIAVYMGYKRREFSRAALAITFLSLLAMASHLLFCGVLADNNAGEGVWNQALILFGACLLAFAAQAARQFKKRG